MQKSHLSQFEDLLFACMYRFNFEIVLAVQEFFNLSSADVSLFRENEVNILAVVWLSCLHTWYRLWNGVVRHVLERGFQSPCSVSMSDNDIKWSIYSCFLTISSMPMVKLLLVANYLHSSLGMPCGNRYWSTMNGPYNGLFTNGTKPLPEPILTWNHCHPSQ